tara:strand:+ start:811 stop:2247 length:1437 start_codon:yes stop_codon:yes gene_type:complete
MSTFDFRILLETVEGQQTSYYSSSFVNTSTDLVLSASEVYHRITGSISASYQNESIFSGSNVNTSFTFKDNTLLSASLSGSQESGSIQFTALDTEYDRLLRYKFIGEKVTNTLGLPNDQWVYVDQVRLPVDDEANIFQGNANLGNVVVTDTLTFAGGSDVNSDVPFLVDTGSDRYIKFVDERGISEIALRMGYDVDTDSYEISGSDDFTVNIGGVDKADITSINGHVTASGFIFSKNTDGGNSIITIENSNTDNGTDKGVGVEFKHYDTAGNSKNAGKIIAGKDSNYGTSGAPNSLYDSNLQFFTTLNGTDTERLKIDSNGLSIFTGRISASGDIITTGDVIAENYIVSSTVTQITTSFSSGSTIFGDSSDDTHQFTGSVLLGQFVQMTNSSSVINTFNTSSFQTCKYVLQVTSASSIQSSEMLVVQNSSNAFNTEYSQINSGLNLLDFTSKVNGANVELIGSSSFISCSVKFVRTLI